MTPEQMKELELPKIGEVGYVDPAFYPDEILLLRAKLKSSEQARETDRVALKSLQKRYDALTNPSAQVNND